MNITLGLLIIVYLLGVDMARTIASAMLIDRGHTPLAGAVWGFALLWPLIILSAMISGARHRTRRASDSQR